MNHHPTPLLAITNLSCLKQQFLICFMCCSLQISLHVVIIFTVGTEVLEEQQFKIYPLVLIKVYIAYSVIEKIKCLT